MPDQDDPAPADAGDELEPDTEPATEPDPEPDPDSFEGPVFSRYGVASTVLALVCVAAVVLGGLVWAGHRDAVDERAYLSRVMQTAAEWADVLINMNSANIDSSLQKLHDKTVGELNTDFDGLIQDYRQVVQKLQSTSRGQIDAVAVETVHRDLDTQPGVSVPVVTTKLPAFASRADSVLVVATSVADNVGGKPQVVRWNLRLEVSDVEGKLMISRMEKIR
jgi:hypothetical protein